MKLTNTQNYGLKLKCEKCKKEKKQKTGASDKLNLSNKSTKSIVMALSSASPEEEDEDDLQEAEDTDDSSMEEDDGPNTWSHSKKKVKISNGMESNWMNKALTWKGKKWLVLDDILQTSQRIRGCIQMVSMIMPIWTIWIGSLSAGELTEFLTELKNSLADTCVVGDNTALLIHDFGWLLEKQD